MSSETHILEEAIERNTPISLLLPINGLMQPFKSRLLAKQDGLIWIEMPAGKDEAVDTAIRDGEPLKASFRSDKLKVEFESKPAQRLRGFKVNNTTRVEAIGLSYPSEVHAVQRRSAYRVGVTNRAQVRFRFWSITNTVDIAAAPGNVNEMTIDVRDFSAGGIGGTWKKRKTGPAAIVAGQRVRVEIIRGGDDAIVLDGRITYMMPVPDPDCRRIGLQFNFEPTNLGDRQKMVQLGQLVGALQRDELRRAK